MKPTYSPKISKAFESLVNNPADTTPELRKAIEAYAATLSGGTRKASPISDDLRPYINKVVRHAYKITDKDVQQLKEAGYSEDAIYELTLCAAMGASLARLECGLEALRGI